ncbi:MAG: MFS transporter [Pseudomonadota bacterium]
MAGFSGLIALALAYIMSQFYRSFLAVLTPDLTRDLGMSNNEMSQALGAWFICFAVAQFLVGPMLDRLGPKRTAGVLFGVSAGGGTALFSLAFAPWMIIAAMGLIGVGCAPVLMAAMTLFRHGFDSRRFAVLSGTFIAIGNAGNLLGSAPLAAFAQAAGWQTVLIALCGVTVAIACGVLLLVRDPLSAQKAAGADGGSYRALLLNRKLWPIFPIMALSYAVVANIRGLWAGPFFNIVHGLDTAAIGSITFVVALAMLAGSLVYGPLDTLFRTRKWVIFGGTLIMYVALLVWTVDPAGPVSRTTVLLAIMGLCGISYPVIMAHGMAFVPPHMSGRGLTLLNFFSIGGTGVMQSVSGFVYEGNAVASDPLSGFSAVLWLYATTTTVALIIFLFATDAPPQRAST